MNSALRVGLAALAVLGLAGCERAAVSNPNVMKVVATTSFGMCVGYCKTTLEITAAEAVLKGEVWGRGADSSQPPQRRAAPVTSQEWEEIAAAAATAQIDALPETIGCPDCDDGGAESLTIVGPQRSRTINFPHGAAIPEAQLLLDRVRELRTRMMLQE
jgi:hypothetical protein